LDAWGVHKEAEGFSHRYVQGIKCRFRRSIFAEGFNATMPNLTPPVGTRGRWYAIPLDMLPEPLRTEVISLLAWKKNKVSPGRGYKGRHRDITSDLLEHLICRIVGFLVAIKGKQVSTLEELFTQENFEEYVKWASEVRNLRGSALRTGLGIVCAAVKHYPPLLAKRFNSSWMSAVIAQIPPDPESLTRRSKESKWVDFAELKQIPDMIAAEIKDNPNASKRRMAWMVQRQLLIKWLITLPWRQRNLRECRLLSGKKHANVFRETLPPLTPIDLPPWAKDALKANPNAKLWQYDFDESETKADRAVHGVVPRPLISLLENFVTHHRPMLLKGTDPGTLFVDAKGTGFSEASIGELVASTALKYVKRWVTPHLFRDIFAVAFLRETRDYLALSKILWHKDPQDHSGNLRTFLRRVL
jgi:hypothetical protein